MKASFYQLLGVYFSQHYVMLYNDTDILAVVADCIFLIVVKLYATIIGIISNATHRVLHCILYSIYRECATCNKSGKLGFLGVFGLFIAQNMHFLCKNRVAH